MIVLKLKVSAKRWQVVLVPTRTSIGHSMVTPRDDGEYARLDHEGFSMAEPLTKPLDHEQVTLALYWLQEKKADQIPEDWLQEPWQRKDHWGGEDGALDDAWNLLRRGGFMDNED